MTGNKKIFWWLGIAAAVFVAGNYGGEKLLMLGLERRYGLNQQPEVLIIGHSHIVLAIDKDPLEREFGVSISKYTREGVNILEREMMIRQFLDRKLDGKLKCVIYGVDPYLFSRGGLSDNTYLIFYPFMNEPAFAEYIGAQPDRTKYRQKKFLPLTRYIDENINASLAGLLGRSDASRKTGIMDIAAEQAKIAAGNIRHVERNAEAEAVLVRTLKYFTGRGIPVLLLNTPLAKINNDLEPEAQQEIDGIYRQLAASSPLIRYWDYRRFFDDRPELFRDPIHLNRNGQLEFMKELTKRLHHESIF